MNDIESNAGNRNQEFINNTEGKIIGGVQIHEKKH